MRISVLAFRVFVILLAFFEVSQVHGGEGKKKREQRLGHEATFDSLLNLSSNISRSNPDSAIALTNKALLLSRDLGDSNMVATCFNYLCIISNMMRNFNAAETYGSHALSIIDSATCPPKTLSSVYGSLAKNFKDQQNYTKAMEFYLRSLKIREQLRDTSEIVATYINLGGVFVSIGNHEVALSYYLKAMELAKNLTDFRTIGSLNNSIAIAYKKLGDGSEALRHYQEALRAFQTVSWPYAEAFVLGNIGALYDDTEKNSDSALAYYSKALEIHKRINDRYGIGITNINMGLVHSKNQEYHLAEPLFKEGERIGNQINSTKLLQYAFDGLAELYEKTNNYKSAFQYYKMNRTIVDSVYSAEKHNQIAELEAKYQSVKKDNEISILQKNSQIQEQKIRINRMILSILLLIFFLGSILVFFIYKWKVTKQESERKNLEIKNLKTEQRMLKVQMNPHFIFNSLNSIQCYISANQSHEATRYLANFARLIRGFLENSRSEHIPLDKEIEILKLYIEMEQLRFENRFRYEINVDEGIDNELTLIPPMLIQPFVENAIIHGFRGLSNGFLRISFLQEENLLLCIVDDDGIGLSASKQNQPEGKASSLATKITQERLALMAEELKAEASFTIIDKADEGNPNTHGTRVEIRIPIG